MIQGDLLLILLALPFAGSLLAAASPANVRHAEAWLSGAVAVAGLGIVAALYPVVAAGGVVRARIEWLPAYGARRHPQDGRLRLDLRGPDHGHRRPRRALCPLLPLAEGPGAALLLLPARLHGGDDRHRRRRQPDPADRLLGADQPLLVPADRLLAPVDGGARRRAHGADRDRRRRPLPAGRHAAARPHRRQLRARRGAGGGRAHPRARALPAGAAAGADRRLHQVGAVPVPLLAAERHGRADAGLGLPALGDDGEGGRVPAGALLAGARRHRRVVLDRDLGRA